MENALNMKIFLLLLSVSWNSLIKNTFAITQNSLIAIIFFVASFTSNQKVSVKMLL